MSRSVLCCIKRARFTERLDLLSLAIYSCPPTHKISPWLLSRFSASPSVYPPGSSDDTWRDSEFRITSKTWNSSARCCHARFSPLTLSSFFSKLATEICPALTNVEVTFLLAVSVVAQKRSPLRCFVSFHRQLIIDLVNGPYPPLLFCGKNGVTSHTLSLEKYTSLLES